MWSIQARAKCTGTVCISGSSWKHLLCVSWNENATSRSRTVSAQTLTLYRAKRPCRGRKDDRHQKNHMCIIFWTYWFPVNELTPHGFGTAFRMNSHAYQSWQSDRGMKNNSLLFPWFAFLSLALRFHGINVEIGLSLRLQTNQQTLERMNTHAFHKVFDFF